MKFLCMDKEMRSKSFRTAFFKIEDTYFIIIIIIIIIIQHKLHWHIYRLLHGRTVSEMLPKILLFGLSLIHQLCLLGPPQHPQSGVLFNSFSTWGTENSLAEINMEITRGDKGL